jgi:tetratricopeptide (TPR) repeat protein
LEKLGAEVGKRIDAVRIDEAPDELFSQVAPSLAPVPEEETGFSRIASEEDSGALDVGLRAITLTPEEDGSARDSPSEALRQAIVRSLLTIRGKNLYEALGVSREAATKEILAACAAKANEFSPAAVAGLALGPGDESKLDALRLAIDRAATLLANPQLRQDYDRTLAPASSRDTDPLGAELAFGEAMRLFNADKIAESVPKFEAAVRARPDQALYHAYLGWAQLLAFGPQWAGPTRAALEHSLALDPDLAEAHAMLGRLAASENDAAAARQHLERSLTLQPIQPDTVELLLQAYQRLNDPKGAEAFLRKLIAALGEQAQPLRRRVWQELASIYENQMGDRLSARIACDMTARLAPNDIDVLRKSAEMNAEDPARWREMASAITAQWQIHPEDVHAGQRLVELFLQQGRQDAAGVAAAALVLRGLHDETIARLAQNSRPEDLRWISNKLAADWPGRLGYSAEFADVEALLALLVETGVLPPVASTDAVIDSGALVAASQQPGPFRSVLRNICELLGVEEPLVILHEVLLGSARMTQTQAPVLLCGPTLLKHSDSVELGFRLSRALALATTGRLAGCIRSGGQLRPYVMAALAASRGSLRFEGPEFEVARDAIAALDVPTRTRIAEISQKLARKYGAINLTAWTKGLVRMASRLSLVICGDLLRVGRAVAEEDGPAALDDLLGFALSFDHLDFAEELRAGG